MALIESSSAETSSRAGGRNEPQVVKPLTRGSYKRLPEVERQIANAASLDPLTLVERAQHHDISAPDFLSPEALVYFIRRAIRDNEVKIRDDLFRELLERCNPLFRGQFRGFGLEDRKDLQGEVQRVLIQDLFAEDDRGDYLQVRFWVYLKRKCIDALKLRSKQTEGTESLDTGYSDAGEPEGKAKLEKAVDRRLSPEQLAMISEALGRLQPHLLRVFLLRHYVGMKIGSDDTAKRNGREPTIAEQFGCSGRTIRNWLKEADRQLADFREEHDGEYD